MACEAPWLLGCVMRRLTRFKGPAMAIQSSIRCDAEGARSGGRGSYWRRSARPPRRASPAPTAIRCAGRSSATCTSTPRSRSTPAPRARATGRATPIASRAASRSASSPTRGDQPLRTLHLARPLDFAAVTDHAEQFGEVAICRDPRTPGYDSWVCRLYRYWPRAAFFVMNTNSSFVAHPTRFAFCGEGGADCLEAAGAVWHEIHAAAEGAYDRSAACRFTTFVGYEWTGAAGLAATCTAT